MEHSPEGRMLETELRVARNLDSLIWLGTETSGEAGGCHNGDFREN
jgi:hypothetical protein